MVVVHKRRRGKMRWQADCLTLPLLNTGHTVSDIESDHHHMFNPWSTLTDSIAFWCFPSGFLINGNRWWLTALTSSLFLFSFRQSWVLEPPLSFVGAFIFCSPAYFGWLLILLSSSNRKYVPLEKMDSSYSYFSSLLLVDHPYGFIPSFPFHPAASHWCLDFQTSQLDRLQACRWDF
jgi:hypothetical protein